VAGDTDGVVQRSGSRPPRYEWSDKRPKHQIRPPPEIKAHKKGVTGSCGVPGVDSRFPVRRRGRFVAPLERDRRHAGRELDKG